MASQQHDRLMASLAAMRQRIPLVVSGDLHAIAIGRMLRSGALDLRGQSDHDGASRARSGRARTGGRRRGEASARLRPRTSSCVKRSSRSSSTGSRSRIFLPDRIVLRFFKWDVNTQPPDAIDSPGTLSHHGVDALGLGGTRCGVTLRSRPRVSMETQSHRDSERTLTRRQRVTPPRRATWTRWVAQCHCVCGACLLRASS